MKHREPGYWKNRTWFSQKFYEEVDVTAALGPAVQRLMDMTTSHLGEGMDGKWATHKGFRVLRVLRIEHGVLWNRYASNRAHVLSTSETLEGMPRISAAKTLAQLEEIDQIF